jgi:hypothetical protein
LLRVHVAPASRLFHAHLSACYPTQTALLKTGIRIQIGGCRPADFDGVKTHPRPPLSWVSSPPNSRHILFSSLLLVSLPLSSLGPSDLAGNNAPRVLHNHPFSQQRHIFWGFASLHLQEHPPSCNYPPRRLTPQHERQAAEMWTLYLSRPFEKFSSALNITNSRLK